MAESYVAVAKRAQTKPISALPLAANAIQTVTGVVCAFAPPKKTRGSDWAASFVITDPSIPLNKAGLTINVFRPHPEMFPELHEGSIVRIEGLKIQTFNGRCQGLSNRTTSFHIVDDDSEIHTLLANWYIMLRSTNVGRQNMTRSSLEITRRPILLVSEITIAKMCDLKATVVHIDGMLNQGQFELTLTDFTDNPLLNLDFSENEQDGLGVFPANMLVRLVAWDENIEQAKLLAVGDRVVFVNVRPKLDDKGRLELYMHGDKQSFGTPRKRIIFLNTISDEDVPRMESRRKKVLGNNPLPVISTRRHIDNIDYPVKPTADTYKSQQSIKVQGYGGFDGISTISKVEGNGLANAGNVNRRLSVPKIDNPFNAPLCQSRTTRQTLASIESHDLLLNTLADPVPQKNKNRVTENITILADSILKTVSIKEIRASKTNTMKYKVRVQVKDFHPRDYKRFTKKVCLECNESFAEDVGVCSLPTYHSSTDYFVFSLLLGDENGDMIPCQVAGDEAVALMGGIQPGDVGKGGGGFRAMKTILGNLWESDSSGTITDAPYFDCFVQSFEDTFNDIKTRRYQLFNTVISTNKD